MARAGKGTIFTAIVVGIIGASVIMHYGDKIFVNENPDAAKPSGEQSQPLFGVMIAGQEVDLIIPAGLAAISAIVAIAQKFA